MKALNEYFPNLLVPTIEHLTQLKDAKLEQVPPDALGVVLCHLY